MNHYHVSFVDDEGAFYSASVETPHDLFTTAGIDDIALELGERLVVSQHETHGLRRSDLQVANSVVRDLEVAPTSRKFNVTDY
ncbi:MAG: hypothetical protein ACYC05_06760 [Sulfuricella sp.]